MPSVSLLPLGFPLVDWRQYANFWTTHRPIHTIVHLSDPHFLAGAAALYGSVDTDQALLAAVNRIAAEIESADAIVVTGDLADRGESDAYDRVAATLEPLAKRLGAQLVWVMGNHDERLTFARRLYGEDVDRPQDRVVDLDRLRLIALDSTVPGYNHGVIDSG